VTLLEHSANQVALGGCLLDPLVDERWLKLLERAPDAGVFHHPLWLRLLRDCYGYPTTAVCLVGADGELVSGLPIATVKSRLTGTRLVSVPFSDVSGPVGIDRSLEPQLMAAVDEERRRVGLSLEVHADVPTFPQGCPSDRFIHHIAPLDGGVDLVLGKKIRQSKRTGASRARRHGVTVTKRSDREALDEFFRLHVGTRHRLGVPTQPRKFFHGLTKLFDRGMGFVLLAEWEDRAIAGAVYLRYKSTLTYKYSAWTAEHHDKRPNDLLQLEALRIGCELGCSALDMGRTELSNDGLRRFKREFGAEEQELSYTIAPPPRGRRSVRSMSNIQRAVIRRSPAAVGRVLGAAIYRHVG
jgi:CelD/BcsL family acetyltransferase involved in cellulose biosynthesis